MVDFGKLLQRGRQRYNIKTRNSEWGRCEQCDERAKLYPFYDAKKQSWMLCEKCADLFANEDDQ